MLYITTREKYDAYTAARTLAGDRAPDGGWYLPFRMPYFDDEGITALHKSTVSQCVARMLNLFFSTKLTAWDIETCIGRNPVKVRGLGQKLLLSEFWRNLEGSYDKLETALASRIHADGSTRITSWLKIAIRISLLFGTYGELRRQDLLGEDGVLDIAVPADDMNLTMAVWYCREMGLPVGNIVCSCSKNSTLWDLLHTGECRAENAPKELERLIFGTLGIGEVQKFLSAVSEGGVYRLLPVDAEKLRNGIFAAVVSEDRMSSVINSVHRTNACILEPDTALAFGGIMDFRAKTGECRATLLLADHSPADYAATVSEALKITPSQLNMLLEKA